MGGRLERVEEVIDAWGAATAMIKMIYQDLWFEKSEKFVKCANHAGIEDQRTVKLISKDGGRKDGSSWGLRAPKDEELMRT